MPSFRYEEYGEFHMPEPHRVGHTYQNFQENKINDYKMKSCVFFEDNCLWIAGSYIVNRMNLFFNPSSWFLFKKRVIFADSENVYSIISEG